MALGLAKKYCHRCEKETVQKAETHHDMLVWICLAPEHMTARIAQQENERDNFQLSHD